MTARRLKVALLMPRTLSMDDSTPPMSLLMLAAVAEAEHSVSIVFPVDVDAAVARLPASLGDADVVGISVNSFNWYRAKHIIAEVRRHLPGARIVLGGPHPTHYHRYCLETAHADAVVRGEGEITFQELLRAWAAGREPEEIAGVTWRDREGAIHVNPGRAVIPEAELARLPLPAYHLVPPGRYRFMPMETSRGCHFRCVFCSIPFPQGIRQFPLARVETLVGRLASLRDRFIGGGIFLSDDSFSADRERVVGTLGALRRILPDAMIGCEARISELLGGGLLAEFAHNNLFMIQVGVECGYESGLRRIKKGLTLDMIADFTRAAAAMPFRYRIYWSYMIGFPWEGAAEVVETVNFAFETARRAGSQQPQINAFSPYPGSDIANRPGDYGLPQPTPEMYDDPAWFNQFLGYSRVVPADRAALHAYFVGIHNTYPFHRTPALLRLPSGATAGPDLRKEAPWD
jgi:anaerobic magnesium-protoporphyrin IX monomethyl ester cyclase